MILKTKKQKNKIEMDSTVKEKLFFFFIYFFVISFSILALLPFWILVLNSVTPEMVLQREGIGILPRGFSLEAYRYLLRGSQVYRSYIVTIIVTVFGTLGGVLVTAPYAYVLYHPRVKYRNIMSFLTYFTMIFGAGLVGFYLLVATWLGLKDNLLALILPGLLNPFFAFILVAYYRSIPYELYEAAWIDGASDLYIYTKIMFPISKPIIATISLFFALGKWNNWFHALLFIDNPELHPLQMMILRITSSMNLSSYIDAPMDYRVVLPTQGVRFATVLVTIGPIILAYPFIQKYFVKGITIGAIKG